MTDYDKKGKELLMKMMLQKPPLSFDAAKVCAITAIDEVLMVIDIALHYNRDFMAMRVNKEYYTKMRQCVIDL